MFKTGLIRELANKTGLSLAKAEEVLNSYIEIVTKTLKKGESVVITNFMTLSVVKTKARKGRNPQTGKEIKIPAGKKTKMTVGQKLKKDIK